MRSKPNPLIHTDFYGKPNTPKKRLFAKAVSHNCHHPQKKYYHTKPAQWKNKEFGCTESRYTKLESLHNYLMNLGHFKLNRPFKYMFIENRRIKRSVRQWATRKI